MAKKQPETPRVGFDRSFREALRADWRRIARPNQLPPPGDWRVWLLLAGRGFGKTRTIVEFVRAEVEAGRACRIALLAATSSDCRDVLVSGHSGILNVFPEQSRPTYEPTKRLLTWPNGAIATMYSADEPDRLRGPQFDLAICDELAAWRYPEALDMLLLGLRIGKNPRVAIATTPRATKVIRDLLAREGKDVVVTRGSTLENSENLAPAYVEQIIERYKGTRLERQEIFGEVLEDTPGALWNRDIVEQTRVEDAPKDLQRIVVAIDPAGSSEEGADETGIIVSGLGADGHGYVLEDLSGRYTPTEWARRALGAYHVWKADRIIAEQNYGGEMVKATIEAVDASVPVTTISSSRGKVLRAEPIAAFFEQRKAHMVGSHPELEDQACRFTSDWQRSRDGSPDRVDAMVFALADLMLGLPAGGFFREAMFLEQGEPVILTCPPDDVFVVIGTPHDTGPGRDTVAVLYCARNNRRDYPLTIIDWDIVPHDIALMGGTWVDNVARRLAAWTAALASFTSGIWIERTPIGGPLLELAAAHRLNVFDVGEHMSDIPAALPERVNLASRYVGTGKLVRIGKDAREKVVTLQGLTRNHLLAQICAFGANNEPPQVEFLHALCIAVILAFPGNAAMDRRLQEAEAVAPHVIHGPAASSTAAALSTPAALPAFVAEMEKYNRDMADYQERERAAIATIREKLGDPTWRPRSVIALGIGAPPENPASRIRMSGTTVRAMFEE